MQRKNIQPDHFPLCHFSWSTVLNVRQQSQIKNNNFKFQKQPEKMNATALSVYCPTLTISQNIQIKNKRGKFSQT